MANAESSPAHASLLCIACGLGKTCCSICLIKTQAEHKISYNERHPLQAKPYRASFIQCPASSIDVWMKDFDKFFPDVFKVLLFYGSELTITDRRRRRYLVTPPSMEELNSRLSALDPMDPQVRTSMPYRLQSIRAPRFPFCSSLLISHFTRRNTPLF
jgi:acetyl-CoA carboxylase beta subunit